MKIYIKRGPHKKTNLKFQAKTKSILINSDPLQTPSFKTTTITTHKLVVSIVHCPLATTTHKVTNSEINKQMSK